MRLLAIALMSTAGSTFRVIEPALGSWESKGA